MPARPAPARRHRRAGRTHERHGRRRARRRRAASSFRSGSRRRRQDESRVAATAHARGLPWSGPAGAHARCSSVADGGKIVGAVGGGRSIVARPRRSRTVGASGRPLPLDRRTLTATGSATEVGRPAARAAAGAAVNVPRGNPLRVRRADNPENAAERVAAARAMSSSRTYLFHMGSRRTITAYVDLHSASTHARRPGRRGRRCRTGACVRGADARGPLGATTLLAACRGRDGARSSR